MLKKSRKKVGKPTGETTKSGRPVYIDDDTGERRSEFSRTIKLKNGKWINIPSIHNGHYYTEDELKEAVEDNRMIPTSEHDNFNEAIAATKKRSKELKQGGVLKAHQGTVVNGQIVYPQTSQAPSDPNPIADPFLTDPNTIPPQQITTPMIKKAADIGQESVIYEKPMSAYDQTHQDGGHKVFTKNDMGDPAEDFVKHDDTSGLHGSQPVKSYDFSTVSTPLQGGMTQANLEATGKASQPAEQKPQYTSLKEFLSGKTNTLQDYLDQNNRAKLVQQFSKDFNLDQKGRNIAMPMIEKMESIKAKYEPKLLELQFKLENNQIDPKEAQNQMNTVYALQMAEQQQVGKNNASLSQDIAMQQSNLEKQFEDAFFKQYKPVGQGNTISKPMAFNEGGTVMEEQMELFDEGGMKDDGGEKDPVSGNDVPSGSMAKEVRDDVPAMVSEGEFIFPADVTRFIGLNNLMEMRQDAKMGLKKMEAMGQLGNPEDADLPDDIPFDAADILIMSDMEEEEEVEKKAQGGVFGYQEGTAGPEAADKYFNIQKEANKQYAKTYAYYKNDAGDMKAILTDYRGQPLEPVPSGYKLMLNEDGSPVTKKPEKAPDDIEATQPAPAEQTSNNEREAEPDPMYSSEYLADKFKGDVITDKNGNPISMTEQGYNAVLTSAQRLGLSANDYFSLPMSARMELAGEEMKALFGGTADTKKASDVLRQVQSGEWKGGSGFLSSLFGGIFDKITGLFSPDGATDEQAIQSLDKAKRNIDPLANSYSANVPNRDRQATASEKQGAANRMKNKYTGPLTREKRKNDLATRYGYDSSPGTNMGRQAMANARTSQSNENRRDQGDKGFASENAIKNRTDSSGKKAGDTGYKSALRERKERDKSVAKATSRNIEEGRKTGNYRGFASGTMVTKPKKKPTPKRKTLVQKKS
jgi:hypothetical protein